MPFIAKPILPEPNVCKKIVRIGVKTLSATLPITTPTTGIAIAAYAQSDSIMSVLDTIWANLSE